MSNFNIKIYHPHHPVLPITTTTTTTVTDYDLSVIVPVYQNVKKLQLTVPLNDPYFRQLGVELVIVVDEPLTGHDFEFLSHYSDLSYTIIVNQQIHKKRSLSTAINVGLRHATKQCVLILAPEFIFANNVIDFFYQKYYQLMSDGEMMTEHHKGYFLTGSLAVVTFNNYFSHNPPRYLDGLNHNSYQSPLFTCKQDLIAVGGYHEFLTVEDNEDEELHWRLNKYGYFHFHENEAHLIYIWGNLGFPHTPLLNSSDPQNFQNRGGETICSPNREGDYGETCGSPNRGGDYGSSRLDFNLNGVEFNAVVIKHTSIYETTSVTNKNNDDLKNYPSIVDFQFGSLCQHYLVMGLMIIDQNQSINPCFGNASTIADGLIILDNSHNNDVWTQLDQYVYSLKIKVELNENALSLKNLLLKICQKVCFSVTWFLWINCGEEIVNTSNQLQLIKNRLKCDSNELLEVNLMENDYQNTDACICPCTNQLGSIRLFKNNTQKLPYNLKPDPKLNYRIIPYDSQLIGSLPLNISGGN